MIYVMSGGGTGKLFAAIGVTYPAGSTCTCTNGTKTLTAGSTTGQWVFSIPETGTWTVTATANDGSGDNASETVEITAEGQFESVELSYQFVLFADGVLASGYTLEKGSISNGVITSTGSGDRSIPITPAVDVTDFATLTVEFGSVTGDGYVTFGLRDTYTDAYDGYQGSGYAVHIGGSNSASGPSNFSNKTFNIDISNITGEKYVKLSLNASSTSSKDCEIKSIIFE